MKVYVSGTFTSQERLRDRADALRRLGHEITSTWVYETARPAHLNNTAWNEELADKDIAEVFAADCIILDRDGTSTTGGRYVEWGIACYPGALKLRYTVGGESDGVFDHKRHQHFKSWDELLAYFQINHSTR